MEQLLLGSELDIDQKETARNVKGFLLNTFEKYLRYAGLNPRDLSSINESHLSSPRMDASGASSRGGSNHTEDSFNRIMLATDACEAVYQTILNCQNSSRRPYRTILERRYLDGDENMRIQAALGYSSTNYDRLHRRACCEFADRIEYWKERYKIDDSVIPSFYVYKEEGEK